jgi:penicillin-binding protein A
MRAFGRWIGIGLALGLTAALAPVVGGRVKVEQLQQALTRVTPVKPAVNPFDGLDLTRLELHPKGVRTTLSGGNVAELTLDPEVQRTALSLMRRSRIPEAGVVLMDVESARLLAYASYVNEGPSFDVNARAEAPTASVFKIVTAAALVERAGLSAGTEQCYHGGKSRVAVEELEDDPARDKWCASLAAAMGRSLNVVFARLARKHLSVEQLTETAGAFGFGASVPFEVPNQAPNVALPEDPVEFARGAAGFWHSTLSPLAGVSIAQTVALGGVTLRPRIVQRVKDPAGALLFEAPEAPVVLRRAVKPDTALELSKMMVQTTLNGSAHKAFFDAKGRAFLPNIAVAGKTGTLTRDSENRFYTWFVGFAPADKPEVAISVLVVNTPSWLIKAPELARDVLRAHFAKQGRAGVTRP